MAETFMIQLFVNHPPRMGETVLTPQGPGTVEDYRKADQMYVILLDWKLANNSPVRSYCQLDQIKKMPAPKSAASAPSSALETTHSPLPRVLKSGTAVDTFMGPGHVVEYRVKDAIYDVELDWQVAGDVNTHAFVNPDSIRYKQMGEKGDFVRTFYGTGQLLGVRQTDGMHIVAIAQCSGSATAFLQPSAIYQTDLKAMVGLSVKTDFGPGVMVQYRHTDNVYVVELTQGGRAYLQAEAITDVAPGPLVSYMFAMEGRSTEQSETSKKSKCFCM